MFTAQSWPIACNMLPFGAATSDGTPLTEASSKVWADHLRQVRELGFDYIDPTDAWLPLHQLTSQRLEEFRSVLDGEGLRISSISMTRSSVVDVAHGEQNLAGAHQLLDIAPSFGATIVNTGFMQALTEVQKRSLWFWLAPGHQDAPQLRDLAVVPRHVANGP